MRLTGPSDGLARVRDEPALSAGSGGHIEFPAIGTTSAIGCAPPWFAGPVSVLCGLLGANAAPIPHFEPLFNAKNTTTTWMDPGRIVIECGSASSLFTTINTSSGAGARNPRLPLSSARCCRIEPDLSRVIPSGIRWRALPSNSPSAARHGSCSGGAAFHAPQKAWKAKLDAIGCAFSLASRGTP